MGKSSAAKNSTQGSNEENSEFEKYSTGAIPDIVDRSDLWKDPPHPRSSPDISILTLPTKYDLRTLNRLPAIRNQNPYGACWAFATFSSLESNFLTQGLGNEIDLAEMFTAFFVYGDTRPGKSFGLNNTSKKILNQGGNSGQVTALTSRLGTVNEETLPYPTNKSSYDDPTLLPEEYAKTNIRIKETYQLGVLSGDAMRNIVKDLIMNKGAVYIHYYSKSGAYQTPSQEETIYFNNDKDENGNPMPINHAVAICGWDDTFSREKV